MNTQNNVPVWMRAFGDWSEQMMSEWSKRTRHDLDEIGASHCGDEAREFATDLNWNVCQYCLGPCGDCKEKHRDQPCCDPCPQDMYGITECTYCPIAALKKLHKMRFQEIE